MKTLTEIEFHADVEGYEGGPIEVEYQPYNPKWHRNALEPTIKIVRISCEDGLVLADAYVRKGARKKDVEKDVEALVTLVKARYGVVCE